MQIVDNKTPDAKDKGHGFYVIGMYPTANEVVMYTSVFTGAKDLNEAIKFGKIAFKCDDRIELVEIQGKKSFKPYYTIERGDEGFVIKENKGDIISKSYYSTSIVQKNQKTAINMPETNGSIHIEVTGDKIKITVRSLTMKNITEILTRVLEISESDADLISAQMTITKNE